jgi:hypothetical protein
MSTYNFRGIAYLLDSCQYGFGKGLFMSTAPLAPACAPAKFNGFHNSSSFVSFCCPRVHNRCVRSHFLRPGLPIRGRTCQSMGCGGSSSSEAPSGLRPTQGDFDATSSRTNKLQVLHPHGNSPVPGKRRTSQLDTSSALGGEYAKRRGWQNDCDPLCHLASEV